MANEANAMIQPIYNCRHREYIELVDSDGAAIALSGADTEVSKDGAAFTDSGADMSEISTGFCSIDFPYTEMAYSCVVVVPKSAGALTRIIKLYPQRFPVLRAATAQAGANGSITLDSGASASDGVYTGCWVRASNNDPAGIQGEVRKINGYTGSTKVATTFPNWDNNPTSATTFEVLMPTDMALTTLTATKAEIIDEFETQSQNDPTGFHVNVKEVNGTTQTANDDSADINTLITEMGKVPKSDSNVKWNATALDSIIDEVIEGSTTMRQVLRLLHAFIGGKASGGGTTTVTFRDPADGTDRIVMTVDDDGNRSAVVLDAS